MDPGPHRDICTWSLSERRWTAASEPFFCSPKLTTCIQTLWPGLSPGLACPDSKSRQDGQLLVPVQCGTWVLACTVCLAHIYPSNRGPGLVLPRRDEITNATISIRLLAHWQRQKEPCKEKIKPGPGPYLLSMGQSTHAILGPAGGAWYVRPRWVDFLRTTEESSFTMEQIVCSFAWPSPWDCGNDTGTNLAASVSWPF
jgi:hypothetical protein